MKDDVSLSDPGESFEMLTDTVDYNSWIDTPTSKKLVKTLDKDVVLAEGKTIALPPM